MCGLQNNFRVEVDGGDVFVRGSWLAGADCSCDSCLAAELRPVLVDCFFNPDRVADGGQNMRSRANHRGIPHLNGGGLS